jgi:hypothetical protein
MSLISTTPEFNPTVVNTNPTQVLEGQPDGIRADLFPDGKNIMKLHNAMHMENMDFGKIAAMEKFISKQEWKVSQTGPWFTYEFSIKALDDLLTKIPKDFLWRDFNNVEFTLHTTLNAYVAGFSALYYDPAPADGYWNLIYGISISDYYRVMFPCVMYQPTKATSVSWTLPLANPFRMYSKEVATLDTTVNLLHRYIRQYSMGRFIAYPIVPLMTGASTITRVPFAFRGRIADLSVTGTDYASTG